MKRGFTLIELMIVTVVLVTLMAIVFRLAGITGPQEARAKTIKRMQCIENCLSGYYAAFGSYPPVKLHGSRNIYLKVDNWGIQEEDGQTVSSLNWASVEAACRSQPVGARYPFSSSDDVQEMVRMVAEELKRRSTSGDKEYKAYQDNVAVLGNGFDALARPSGEIDNPEATDWREVQIFQFGLLSYILPRYLFMTLGNSDLYGGEYAQWNSDNMVQKQCHGDGRTTYTWDQIRNDVLGGHSAYVTMIPSQAVCARWLPNLEKICKCNYPTKMYPHMDEFFGIHIKSPHWRDSGIFDSMGTVSKAVVTGVRNTCFAPDDDNPYESMYLLDEVTVQDGWGNEFYYYSRSPYQSYTLWSSGPDGKTFPPWISRDNLQSSARSDSAGTGEADRAAQWTKDDIIHLSN